MGAKTDKIMALSANTSPPVTVCTTAEQLTKDTWPLAYEQRDFHCLGMLHSVEAVRLNFGFHKVHTGLPVEVVRQRATVHR